MNRDFLRNLLVEESFAYGFTIAFWGSGLLLIDEYGLLRTVGIFAYAGGTVTGFGVLAVATFGAAIDTVDTDGDLEYFVLASIHYLAGLVPIAITRLLVVAPLGKTVTLFVAGMAVAICYNVFVAVEELISEATWKAEQTVLDQWD
ncbi:MAG: hypothetical protein ACOCY1_01260 [Halovenus sp.]